MSRSHLGEVTWSLSVALEKGGPFFHPSHTLYKLRAHPSEPRTVLRAHVTTCRGPSLEVGMGQGLSEALWAPKLGGPKP